MSKKTYCPDRGDVVLLNFMPSAGREIDKRRPAIILSPQGYNSKGGLCLAVPLSSDLTVGPFWIPAPAGLLDLPSMVLCDHIRSMDWRERSIAFVSKAPRDLIDEITARVMDLVDPLYK